MFAEFRGLPGGSGPLTWGQQGIWSAIRRHRAGHFNAGLIVPLVDRPGMDLTAVVGGIEQLLARHDALRTRIRTVAGELRQVVATAGTLPVEVDECHDDDVTAVTDGLFSRLHSQPFEHDHDLPFRVGVVRTETGVRQIALIFCHSAADLAAMHIVARDLDLLLGGQTLPDRAIQPLELAQRQRSAALQRRSAQAVTWWTTTRRRLPVALFTDRVDNDEPRFRNARLHSRAVGPAVRRIAAEHDANTSTVFQAACAVLVGRRTGHRAVAMSSITGNRFWPGHAEVVSNLCQLGLFALDLTTCLTLADLLHNTELAAMVAYRNAYYDQQAMDRAVDMVRRERGGDQFADCYYNDGRIDEPATGVGADPKDTDLRRLQAGTTVAWLPDPELIQCRFSLRVMGTVEQPVVSLSADTRYVPSADIERFLLEYEAVLVQAATGAAALGITR